jgi:hypothetical protein
MDILLDCDLDERQGFVRFMSIPNDESRVIVDILSDEPRSEHLDEPFLAEMVISPPVIGNTNAVMMRR